MPGKEELYDDALDLAFEGNYREAIAKYREALSIDATYADALHGLAMAHAELDEIDEAIAAAKQLCDIAPDDILAHTSLSTFYQRKGLIQEAEAVSAKAKMLDWKRQLREQKEGGS